MQENFSWEVEPVLGCQGSCWVCKTDALFGSSWAWSIVAMGVKGMRMCKKQCDSDSDGVDGRKDSGVKVRYN